ncbi:hypothetical protein OCS_05710 [Ophiocordyceps sinensis CO18]|uniref:Uncharacterized protein n=1 Tax=Ophiocordyceps sinensis (strain Co18 / CGMCC 3.14243) TaxID=911162 RepID=T5A825_OPHSC|nr:hypothetical protein OCS_05710 [Ophiocordyceps sinensis CO18]
MSRLLTCTCLSNRDEYSTDPIASPSDEARQPPSSGQRLPDRLGFAALLVPVRLSRELGEAYKTLDAAGSMGAVPVGNRPWRADLLMIRDRRGQLKHQHLLADHPEQQVIVDGDPAKVHRNVDAAEEEEEEEEERPTEEEVPTEEEEEGPTLPKKWAGS